MSPQRTPKEPQPRPRDARARGTNRGGVAGRWRPDQRDDRRRGGAHPPGRRPRRSQLTGRAAVLMLVVCGLALSLAYPAREYLAQRSEIQRLEAERAAVQLQVQRLHAERRRWDDPEFVKARARERLHYAMPGEKAYVAVGPNLKGPDQPPAQTDADLPWYTRLWRSVANAAAAPADAPGATPAPTPSR